MANIIIDSAINSIVISNKDNVATLLKDVQVGEEISYKVNDQQKAIKLKQAVLFGHKVAIESINSGKEIIKYGEVIGVATTQINPGDHVHVHNIEGVRGRGDKA